MLDLVGVRLDSWHSGKYANQLVDKPMTIFPFLNSHTTSDLPPPQQWPTLCL